MDCRLTRRILHIASTVGCFLATGSAQADIIHVPKDYATIQGAINVASKGDEIIVAPGTYNEQINFLGQAITLRSIDGPESTIIDALGKGHVVTFASGEGRDSELAGFAITGGGRGIYCFNESGPMIRSCLFVDNSNNEIQCDAGSTMRVENCLFLGGQGPGGGIYTEASDMEILDCQFLKSANPISCLNGTASILGCDFMNNSSTGGAYGGGAIWSYSNDTLIERCRFIGNSSNHGGAIDHGGGALTVHNSLFIGNTASQGGAFFGGSIATFSNCTFMGNEANAGGALKVAGSVTVANSILWLNMPNQVEGDALMLFSDIHGGWDGDGEGNINAYPMFVDMEGGDLRLLEDSPCIDMGSNDAVPEDLIVDLDGNERIVDGDDDGTATVDMGAYEYQGHPVCAEDMDGDGAVVASDLAILLGGWGFNPGHPADLDHDGMVGASDLAMLLGAWGPCP